MKELNIKGHNLGIIFRRCPVDFSTRFDTVLENTKRYRTYTTMGKKRGKWNTILPTPEDFVLQMNTIAHTEMVVNFGSSMVFDYVTLINRVVLSIMIV